MITLAVAGTTASAQTKQEASARFEMQETERGLVRLDTKTGMVSLCGSKGDKLICQPSIDATQVYEDEIKRLEQENARLRQKFRRISESLAHLTEETSVAGIKQEKGLELSGKALQNEGWLGYEEERKLNEALEFSENAMRRFFSVIEEMKEDFQKEKNAQ